MCKSLFVICFIAVICLIKESSPSCKPFDKDSGLASLCGYSATANFTHLLQYNNAIDTAKSIYSRFRSCSEYAAIIACSLNVPRCEPNIPGPFLPCRRVCDEFHRNCMKQILRNGLEWIIWKCQLLPEKDDPNKTKLGYLGRCFEPPNFKTNLNKSTPIKCSNIIVPSCQNIGYTKTEVSENTQRSFGSHITSQVQKKNSNPACDLPKKKLYCMVNLPPCLEDKIGSYCRPKCEKYFEMNCTTPSESSDYIKCAEHPIKKSNVSDICYYTDWPKSWQWPEVRKRQELELAASTTTPRPEGTGIKVKVTSTAIASTSPDIFSTRPTSKEIKEDSKTDPIRRTEGPTKTKLGVVLGGAFALLFVIAAVIVIAVVLHKKRQRQKRGAEKIFQQSSLL